MDLFELLDSLYLELRGVKMRALELYERVIPSIITKLKELNCELCRIYNRTKFNEIELVFKCESTCVYIKFEVEAMSIDVDKIRLTYSVGSCW